MAYYVFRINYDDKFKIIRNEIMQGRLRQGWGAPGMDLNKGCGAYISAWDSYWGQDDEINEKKERKYNNLLLLKKIAVGDYIVVPKLSLDDGFDEPCRCFTLLQCVQEYSFNVLDGDTENGHFSDFGHIIGVKTVFSCSYDRDADSMTVAKSFRAYQSAVNNVWNATLTERIGKLIESNENNKIVSSEYAKSLIFAIAQDVYPKYNELLINIIDSISNLSPHKFEDLIVELFEKNGYITLQKNDFDRMGGDIDILMTYDQKSLLGNIFSMSKDIESPNINIQAKKKPGTDFEDKIAVEQLLKRAETKSRKGINDINIVIDLTSAFQECTEKLAKENNVILINGLQFASLLIQYGINGEINE